jgi:glucose-6-phosphate-specific signal transduction histidine kinase
MKTGRWFTWIGGALLFLTGIGHCLKIADIQKMIDASTLKLPLEAILKACWLAFGGEMVALAVIAIVASALGKGGRIVLLCAATMLANALVVYHFMGGFIGVYISVVVAVFFLAGGWMQSKAEA